MASRRTSMTKELLHESLESFSKPSKIHSLDQLVLGRNLWCQISDSSHQIMQTLHIAPRARCEESVLAGYFLSSCFVKTLILPIYLKFLHAHSCILNRERLPTNIGVCRSPDILQCLYFVF